MIIIGQMKKSKTIEEIEKELIHMRELHMSKEKGLQREIDKKLRELTVKRWDESGLLEGLTGVREKCAQLFENQLALMINESTEEDKNETIKEDPSQIIDN